jgi:hypothetical protein
VPDWYAGHGLTVVVSGAGERVGDVGYPHPNNLCSPAGLRCAPVIADVGDDHGAVVPDGHLGSMTLAYPRSLDEAEGGGQEVHCSTHVRIGEHRYDRGRRDRAVDFHRRSLFSGDSSDRVSHSTAGWWSNPAAPIVLRPGRCRPPSTGARSPSVPA